VLPRQYVGAGSCSASGCHNANFTHGVKGSEFTAWMTRDPHGRAYEGLFGERARHIQQKMRSNRAAHEERRCLLCHVAPEYDAIKSPAYFVTDGVSCESCHGPAKQWLPIHHLDAWKSKSPAEKATFGMADTRTLPGRAQMCARCHVGAGGMDVDHDLVAAGHPRLYFEFAAFHAHMPHHWKDAEYSEVQAWGAGQLATTDATLKLLADRAKAGPWPEFALQDCASCHHNLDGRADRTSKRKPGAFAIGPLGAALDLVPHLTPGQSDLHDALLNLRQSLDRNAPRQQIFAHADVASRLLIPGMLPKTLDEAAIARALRGYTLGDGATYRSLMLASLHDRIGGVERDDALAALRLHAFDPEAIRRRLTDLKSRPKRGTP
jgi:hypothetical protein